MNYEIVWVDDTKDWVDSVKETIEEFLAELGYKANIKYLESGDTLLEHSKRPDLDLIIIDYRLPGTNGDKWIEKIRDSGSFIQIVFYSQEIQPNEVIGVMDDVYHSTRDDAENIIKKVIEFSIRKNQDVEVIRGLIIAESIDIENILEEIIVQAIKGNSELLQGLILSTTDCTFSKKFKIVSGILEEKIKESALYLEKKPDDKKLKSILCSFKDTKEIYKKFSEDVIDCRNILAHSKKTVVDKKIILKGINKRTKQINFNSDWVQSTRQALAKHKKNLQSLCNSL